jgi:hypothetical protein
MSPGKHPRTKHGWKDATLDQAQIKEWWDRWPQANIGIATGTASGLWVLDVDTKKSVDVGGGSLIPLGVHSLRVLEAEQGPLPDTLVQVTGSGGLHYLFTYPSDELVYGNRTNMRPGIDVRAEGGYIVAPPSNHESGHEYLWANEESPVVDAPAWLLAIAREHTGSSTIPSVSDILSGGKIPVGERNSGLFKIGSAYRGVHGFSEKQIFGLLMVHNMEDLEEPLDPQEVQQIARNCAKQDINPTPATWVSDAIPNADETIVEIEPGEDLALSLDQLMKQEIAQPPALIKDLLDGGEGAILAGPPNVGKSWLALEMALAVATGGKFLHEFEVEQGSVLIIDEEGTEWGDQRRFDMLLEGRGVDNITDLPLYLAIGKGYKLDTKEGLTAVRRMIERYKPNLVIIDSLIRVHSGDENVSKDMAKFFQISTKLMRSTGTAFVFVHHIKKIGPPDQAVEPGELMRGTSEIRAWPSVGFVVLPGEDGMMEVHNVKQRWREKPDPFNVRLLVSSDKSSAKLGFMGPSKKKGQGTVNTGQRILALVQEIIDGGGHPTAPLIAYRMGKGEATTKTHLRRLVAGGLLRQTFLPREPGQRGPEQIMYVPSIALDGNKSNDNEPGTPSGVTSQSTLAGFAENPGLGS